MKVWISKYALSGGIKEVEAELSYDGKYAKGSGWHAIGRDAHTNREAAVVAAEWMRVKKIASLKKQIARLEKMTFSEED